MSRFNCQACTMIANGVKSRIALTHDEGCEFADISKDQTKLAMIISNEISKRIKQKNEIQSTDTKGTTTS